MLGTSRPPKPGSLGSIPRAPAIAGPLRYRPGMDLVLHTPRLTLRWPDRSQIGQFYRDIAGSSAWDTVMWDGGPRSTEELAGWWQRRRWSPGDEAPRVTLGVIERATGHCVGSVELVPGPDPRIRELGYLLAPRVHGQGYATEAVGAVVDHGFLELACERVHCPIFANNPASRRVAEKLGFRLEGTLRRAVCKNGVWLDKWVFGLTRPDWESRDG